MLGAKHSDVVNTMLILPRHHLVGHPASCKYILCIQPMLSELNRYEIAWSKVDPPRVQRFVMRLATKMHSVLEN